MFSVMVRQLRDESRSPVVILLPFSMGILFCGPIIWCLDYGAVLDIIFRHFSSPLRGPLFPVTAYTFCLLSKWPLTSCYLLPNFFSAPLHWEPVRCRLHVHQKSFPVTCTRSRILELGIIEPSFFQPPKNLGIKLILPSWYSQFTYFNFAFQFFNVNLKWAC